MSANKPFLETHHKILSKTSDGKLTPEEVYNLEKYGVKHPSELRDAEEWENLPENECICGELDCKDEYVHWTSGW